jgi:hypothetical protein
VLPQPELVEQRPAVGREMLSHARRLIACLLDDTRHATRTRQSNRSGDSRRTAPGD